VLAMASCSAYEQKTCQQDNYTFICHEKEAIASMMAPSWQVQTRTGWYRNSS